MKRLATSTIMLLLSAPFIAAVEAQVPPPRGGFSPGGTEARDPDTAIKFNLSTPGARSLAMGGAFVGLADDATAAYTNPAGLTNLALGGSEVAVEVRQTRFTSSFADVGHYNTDPDLPTFVSFIGQDFVDGLPRSEAVSETSGLSFLSFGYVLPGGLTVAAYRHELANFRSSFESQGPFNDDFCFDADTPNGCDRYRVLPRRSSIDLEIVNYGASVAYAFDLPPLGGMESNLSLGLGLSYYEMELDGLRETFDLCRFDPGGTCTESRLPGGFYGPADFSPDNLFFLTRERGDDDAFGFNLGFLWKVGRQGRWSIGGVFRQGPDFETTQESEIRFFGVDFAFEEEPGRVTVPNVFGVGIAFRSADGKTKITFDVNQIQYSQTLGDFTAGFDPDSPELANFDVADVTQFHLGFERTILVVESLFVGTARFGAWYEPFHEPEYVGDNRDLVAILSRPTDDEVHLSAGLGLVIKEDYQVDLAADFSDPTNSFSVSLVKFF